MLMNLRGLEWDLDLCEKLGIHVQSLPTILSSSSDAFGRIHGGVLHGVKITGCLTDHHAHFLGLGCTKPGDCRILLGNTALVSINCGNTVPPASPAGLVVTVG